MAALSRAPVASLATLNVEASYYFHVEAALLKRDPLPSYALYMTTAMPSSEYRSDEPGKEDVPAESFSTMPRTPSATAMAMAHDDSLEPLLSGLTSRRFEAGGTSAIFEGRRRVDVSPTCSLPGGTRNEGHTTPRGKGPLLLWSAPREDSYETTRQRESEKPGMLAQYTVDGRTGGSALLADTAGVWPLPPRGAL
ncbi:hypothetical protein VPNG_00088 [Cytospora leucostoma]|uniref:Uncharacterized protein n=1 Tax=Cytospora leucostoma TaxID=1230097 RepID=A0A423XPD2_9PEZI|nr:hypothetical protein VPNG_00088 [Cytospora leucostoma]